MSTSLQGLSKAPYPEEADREIRKAAEIFIRLTPFGSVGVEALRILEVINKQLFGDAEKAKLLAEQWAERSTMKDSREAVQDAKNNLAGLWEGPAFAQFDRYASNMVSILDTNHGVMKEMGTLLAGFVRIVFNTYASALTFMGQCAGEVVGIGASAALLRVPGANIVAVADIIMRVVDALSSFVSNVTSLIADNVRSLGEHQATEVSLQALLSKFQSPATPGGEVGHTSSWVVVNRKSR